MAETFESSESIDFVCTWSGLSGRRVADFNRGVDWQRRVCRDANRTSRATASVASLRTNWQETVSEIVAHLTVLFDGLEISPEWVAELAKSNWRG